MLCRQRHEQAKDPLLRYRDRSISGNEHLKNTPSYYVSLALARLPVDCSASRGFSRVFIKSRCFKNIAE